MENRSVDQNPRRLVLRRALQFAAAIAVAPQLIRPAAAAEACVDHSSESLRASLHYVSVSPDPAKPCSACGFFTLDAAKPACGNCVIMTGPVDEKGHCESWSPRE
jgi:hypothetical protein